MPTTTITSQKSAAVRTDEQSRRRSPGVKPVVYDFRYFLPYAPEWGTKAHCQQRLEELVAFCRQAQVDTVQFFVNIRSGTYYMPARSAEEQKIWAAWMRDVVAPTLRSAGIGYQLNLQMILGGTTWGEFDLRGDYDWEFLVDQHGQESLGCACPIGPRYRHKMGAMLRLWADTKPEVVWVDDDFRMHNHSIQQPEMDYYCFCPLHLNAFAQRVGQRWTREALVAEILRPGPASPVRGQWLDFLGETMIETATWIREQVHGVSPQTRLAQMTSLPDVHSAEGRDWGKFLKALCGPYQPMTRPCSGLYTASNRPVKDNAVTYRFFEQSIVTLEKTLGVDAVQYRPELENARFTTWAKTAVNSRYVLVLSQLLGCREITLSMADLDGSSLSEEPANALMLHDTKPFLQAVANLDLRGWRPLGVSFLTAPCSARKIHLSAGGKLEQLHGDRPWEEILTTSGVPTRYVTPAEAGAEDEVVVLDAFTAWLPSDEELRRILSRGVLLDADSARVLQQRGFGEFIGVTVAEQPQRYAAQSEIYYDDLLPGVYAARVPHKGFRWHEIQLAGARRVSDFIDPQHGLHVGSALFENTLGGRVVTYAHIGEFQPYAVFGNHARLRWLRGAIQWLSRGNFPLLPLTRCHGLTIARRHGDETLLAWANLSTDLVDELVFTASEPPPAESLALADNGTWHECPVTATEDKAAYQLPCSVQTLEWVVIKWKS
jgi:hypothetical protein